MRIVWAFVLLVLWLFTGCTPEEPAPDSPVKYLWQEAKDGSTDSVIIAVHGGCWYLGKPEDIMLLLKDTDVAETNSIAAIEYTLAGQEAWPAQREELKSLIDYFTNKGYRVAVVGYSAGAHITVATLQETNANCGVGISGYYDFTNRQGLNPETESCTARFALEAIEDPSVYNYNGAPLLLMHGSDDTYTPPEQSIAIGETVLYPYDHLWPFALTPEFNTFITQCLD